MIEEIKQHLDNPKQLETLYRKNRSKFRQAFNLLYPDIQADQTAKIWNERLNFEAEKLELSWGKNHELIFVIVAGLVSGLLAKIPEFTAVKPDYFYPRNMGFIVFPMLAAYFAWKQRLNLKQLLVISAAFVISVVYINLVPFESDGDTLLLSCIHLPLFLWTVLGYTFVGESTTKLEKRLDFLKYNGDLAVMTAVILFTGVLLTVVTIGLFSLIDVNISEFYLEYVVVFGLSAAPIVGTFLVKQNPLLVGKVSPVIAKVFTPLVLATLIVYLFAVIYTKKNPYEDREFLVIFNLLLIGVMAIILFSIAEKSKQSINKIGTFLLLALSLVTVIVNGIALSAILFRIHEWGTTPNRLAVLGSNTLIITNLISVTWHLFQKIKSGKNIAMVERSIALFLPFYSLWTVVVTFLFPFLFSFQ